jgi:hypothetical protein
MACSLDHKLDDCPFIYHSKHKDSGIMELYYPAFYRLDDKEITAYLTLLTSHGFLKSLKQEEVDEIVNIISRKRRSFQNKQEDPERDTYRRNKAKYGDYPSPPDVNRNGGNRYHNNRYDRYDNGNNRNVDNRPSWKERNDKQQSN